MDLFNLDAEDECLFCDGECTCKPNPEIAPRKEGEHWAVALHTGSPVYVDKLRDKTNVWAVVISNDRFNETIICFDKHSGRHSDVAWDRLTPTPGYAK